MAARLTRKEMKQDKFVEDANIAYEYASSHRSLIFGSILGVILVIAAIWGIWIYRAGSEAKAQARLGEAITVMDSPTGATPGGDPAAVKYKSEEEKIAKALPMFEDIAKNHSGSDAADVAEIFIARISASRGDLASARKKLQEFVDEHPDHMLAATAQLSLYELDLASGDPKTVATQIEQKVNAQDQKVPTDALLSLLAKAYEMSGDHAKARDVYRRIVTEFPDSPYTIDAQRNVPPAA